MRSPTKCGVSEGDHESSITRRPWSTGGCCVMLQEMVILIKVAFFAVEAKKKAKWPLYVQKDSSLQSLHFPIRYNLCTSPYNVSVCSVGFAKHTAIISLYLTNRLVVIMTGSFVFC
jgi:hypothetical protein